MPKPSESSQAIAASIMRRVNDDLIPTKRWLVSSIEGAIEAGIFERCKPLVDAVLVFDQTGKCTTTQEDADELYDTMIDEAKNLKGGE
jgi:hypothetical protein